MKMTMTQEERELLFRDLSARLPYGVMVRCKVDRYDSTDESDECDAKLRAWLLSGGEIMIDGNNIRPYLRPMSSMTEKERTEREKFIKCIIDEKNHYRHYVVFPHDSVDYHDWLNAHHFDYRGLIEKELALEAPEGMYKIESL